MWPSLVITTQDLNLIATGIRHYFIAEGNWRWTGRNRGGEHHCSIAFANSIRHLSKDDSFQVSPITA